MRIILLVFLFILVFSFSNTVLLQIALPLTGVHSDVGISELNAIKLAYKTYNFYKGYEIKLKITDISTNVEKTTKKFANSKAIAIMGYPFSSYAIKAVNIAENSKIPVILTTATNSLLIENKKYIHMVMPSDKTEAKVMSDFVINNFKNPKIAFVYDENELYCKGLASRIYLNFQKKHFLFKRKNFLIKSELNKKTVNNFSKSILRYSPDLIIFLTYPNFSAELVNTLIDKGSKSSFLFVSSLNKEIFFDTLKLSKNSKLYISAVKPDIDQDFYKSFVLNYEKSFKQLPALYAIEAYNSYLIFFNAVKYLIDHNLAVNRKNFNSSIKKLHNIQLAGGTINTENNQCVPYDNFLSYSIFTIDKNVNYSYILNPWRNR